jgi:hypothetical protein
MGSGDPSAGTGKKVDMKEPGVPFPDLVQIGTMELPVIAAVSGILGAVVFTQSKIVGGIIALPALLWVLYGLSVDVLNTWRRWRWAAQFDGRLSGRQAIRRVRAAPDRYLLHVGPYGGFDVVHLKPAAVLEARAGGTRWAISPPSRKVVGICEKLNVPIRDPYDEYLRARREAEAARAAAPQTPVAPKRTTSPPDSPDPYRATTLLLKPGPMSWTDDREDDPEDLCAHGGVELKIDEYLIIDPEEDDWTVSAAAVHLLRTLEADHTPKKPVADQIFPCCGHTMIDSKHTEDVVIVCCPTGLDFQVKHTRKGVILTFDDDQSYLVPDAAWKRAVCGFSDAVKKFYDTSSPKILPPDDEDTAAGFRKFMREWETRRRRIDVAPGP